MKLNTLYSYCISDEIIYRKMKQVSANILSLNINRSVMNSVIHKKILSIQYFASHSSIGVYCFIADSKHVCLVM